MEDRELSTILELAKLKKDSPEEYAKVRLSIKEVTKDIARLGIEISEELNAENNEMRKKEKEELNLRIAEKMKRDKPRVQIQENFVSLKYTKISFDGVITETDDLTLKEMQEFVGGYIEYAGNIICNEDGRMLKLPRNKIDPRFLGNIIIQNRFDIDD